ARGISDAVHRRHSQAARNQKANATMTLQADMAVHGEVSTGFEPVRAAFAKGAADLGEGGGAFSAYVQGRKVIDLWTGWAAPQRPWSKNTLSVLMSSTKGLVTMCAQILVDRGQLDVDERVATYWPEFAQAGKDAVLVRHLLTHTVGLLGFPEHAKLLLW